MSAWADMAVVFQSLSRERGERGAGVGEIGGGGARGCERADGARGAGRNAERARWSALRRVNGVESRAHLVHAESLPHDQAKGGVREGKRYGGCGAKEERAGGRGVRGARGRRPRSSEGSSSQDVGRLLRGQPRAAHGCGATRGEVKRAGSWLAREGLAGAWLDCVRVCETVAADVHSSSRLLVRVARRARCVPRRGQWSDGARG